MDGPEQLAAYLERAGRRWKVAYHNDHLNDDFPALCEAVYRMGHVLLVIDEVDWFTSPSYIDEAFERIVKYGRHVQVTTMTACRMPTSEMHPLIRKLAWEMYCFAVDEPADVDYLRKKIGPAFSEAVIQLPELECLRVNLLDRREPVRRLRVNPKTLAVQELGTFSIWQAPEEPDEPS